MTPGEGRPSSRWLRRGRLGRRSEVQILLPAALVLSAVLSSFTLASYRSALLRLTEERRDEAARLAASAAATLAGSGAAAFPAAPGPGLGKLASLAPGARAVAVVDAAGHLTASSGEPPVDPLAAAGGRPVTQPLATGPDERFPDSVVGLAPLPGGGVVRVELPAATLSGQRRAIGILSGVVLAVDAALLLLVIFFLRHLLAPYETLLARARQAGELGLADGQAGGEDEVELLVGTFERALAALALRPAAAAPAAPAAPAADAGEEDIAALERTLSASLQSGLLLLDREGRVLALNEVGAALLGVAPPSPGTPLASLLSGHPELAALLSGAIAEEREVNREECTLHSPALTLGLTVHPLRRAPGSHAAPGSHGSHGSNAAHGSNTVVRGYLVLFADLTSARQKAEEGRLAESLAQLGEMAAGVAHELRNSLATFSGYITLLERRPEEPVAAGYLAEIRHEADHLARVVSDFLAFARPGTARPEELALGTLLKRAAADPALAGLPVELTGDLDSIYLYGDPQLLERAFGNLLRNAAEASRAAGSEEPIEVRVARAEGGGAEVVVADRGRGVPPELRERLFHPFATGRPDGVGLGLAVAQRVVNLHGGNIRLEDREGGGTEARIAFPPERLVEQSRYPR